MAKHVEVIARGLMERGGRVLLCRSVRGGYCYLPGGHVEFGEGCREALAREFMEETGVRVRVGDFVSASEGAFVHKGKRHHEINLVFHVEQSGVGEITSQEAGIEFIWATKSQAARLDVRPAAAKRLIKAKTLTFDSDLQ